MYRLKVRIKIKGPVISNGNGAIRFGVDNSVLRKPKSGNQPYFPESHILGKVRDAYCDLFGVEEAKQVFGEGGFYLNKYSDNKTIQARKIVSFSDFVADRGGGNDVITRIAINSESGTALEGAIQVIECPFKAGEEVCFAGELRINIPSEKINILKNKIKKAMNWIPQIGAYRSVGFGQIISIEFGKEIDKKEVNEICYEDRFYLSLKLMDPFCISEAQRYKNLFSGKDIIEGSVIKGAIANNIIGGWNLIPESIILTNLSKIKISHFKPHKAQDSGSFTEENFRFKTKPLSLVFDDKDELYDMALCKEPELLNDKAPKFSTDWKNRQFEKYGEESNTPTVDRQLSIRTKISKEYRTSEDEMLFGYDLVQPDGLVWNGFVDFSRLKLEEAEKKILMEEFQKLISSGLGSIGKTNAFAELSLIPIVNESEEVVKKKWCILILETPALLLTHEDIYCDGSILKRDQLLSSYRKAFGTERGLCLSHFFASQYYSGGDFFRNKYPSKKQYKPWIMTSEGSVFVFEVQDFDLAKTQIEEWKNVGIQIPNSLLVFYELAKDPLDDEFWMECPYNLENGFGEARIRLLDGNPVGEKQAMPYLGKS